MEAAAIFRTVVLKNRHGLHARAACLFAELCGRFQSEILVGKESAGDPRANAKSILEVLTLGAERGATLVLSFNGLDAESAAEAVVRLVETNFHGEER